MEINQPYVSAEFVLNEKSQVGEVRRYVISLAEDLHFNETEGGKAGIITTELGSNLIKHGGGGKLLIRQLQINGITGIEILSIDSGPGMSDINRCMEDGYSTAGSPGTGLGAVARLSSFFDIYSQVSKGTVIMAQLWKSKTQALIYFGAICLPLSGEKYSGDGWAIQETDNGTQILVVDGLGHGEIAAQAAHLAIEHFPDTKNLSQDAAVKSMHLALRSSRGAAMAIALLNKNSTNLQFAGVGNISGILYHEGKTRGLLSHNGIVGHQIHKVVEMQYPWSENGLLIMHSDGLQTRWKLEDYPGLKFSHPALIAAVLYRDYSRGRDDITILVIKAYG